MIITTTTNGNNVTVEMQDSGKNFTFEISVNISENGRAYIDYTNSARDTYNLLMVEGDGLLTNEVPTLE